MNFFSESRLIAFYADGLPFDGATIFEGGLGGSESALFFLPFSSYLTVMWNHDILDSPESYLKATFRADLFFTLSAYHEAEYLAQLPELAPYFHRTRNGVDLALIEPARLGAVKQMNKVIYASRPERGLDILLKYIWPRLLTARPHLELHIAGYQAPDKPGYEHIPDLLAT